MGDRDDRDLEHSLTTAEWQAIVASCFARRRLRQAIVAKKRFAADYPAAPERKHEHRYQRDRSNDWHPDRGESAAWQRPPTIVEDGAPTRSADDPSAWTDYGFVNDSQPRLLALEHDPRLDRYGHSPYASGADTYFAGTADAHTWHRDDAKPGPSSRRRDPGLYPIPRPDAQTIPQIIFDVAVLICGAWDISPAEMARGRGENYDRSALLLWCLYKGAGVREKDIADVWGIAPQQVSKRFQRARELLREAKADTPDLLGRGASPEDSMTVEEHAARDQIKKTTWILVKQEAAKLGAELGREPTDQELAAAIDRWNSGEHS